VSGDDYNDLPTARSTLRARYVALLVWCKGGCRHDLWSLGAGTCR
jgi:hypothetical protein